MERNPSVCPSSNELNFDFALALYNPDGSLDSGFGSGGTVATPINSFSCLTASLFTV
jgi:hypothetical protein